MDSTASDFTREDLEQRLRGVEPGALLVPTRILRRVIKHDRDLSGPGLQVPHRKSYVIGRDALLAVATRAELGVDADRLLPDVLILLPEPAPFDLRGQPAGAVLRDWWRLLFHARIHVALRQRFRLGDLDETVLRCAGNK